MSDWKTWFRGLVAAVIGGTAQVATGFAVGVDPHKLIAMAGVAAITNAGHYLSQSPLPATRVTVSETTTQTVETKKE
jgi:hypothetical protein